MLTPPASPFTTADFSPQGGGIDFLGLRWVSLTIVGRDLVSELNNVTQDMGVFCIGAWVPWKFRQLCKNEHEYTVRNYTTFREKVEVALSMTYSSEAVMPRPHGVVRRQLGSTQKVNAPQRLAFTAVKRGPENSLYAAANYGPALQALGLIASYRSQARDGKESLRIPITSEDAGTTEIVESVDKALRAAPNYSLLSSLDAAEASWSEIRDLGVAGLDPARLRAAEFAKVKRAFREKLLPRSVELPGFSRTLTTRLIIETLRDAEGLSDWELRNVWYTGRYNANKKFSPLEPMLQDHCARWSCLMARQYQRYPLELFLWCFEEGLGKGARSIDEIVTSWRKRSPEFNDSFKNPFREYLNGVAGDLLQNTDLATSRLWNRKVIDLDDDRFEHVKDAKGDLALDDALYMLGAWFWRVLARLEGPVSSELMKLGGSDRMAMSWFVTWLSSRLNLTVGELVREIFSDLVFAQHMRIALARFDGKAQRLRFMLGDSGIEPTVSALKDLAKLPLPWMPDRLNSLIGLLCDCDVLKDEDGRLSLGRAAHEIADIGA
jgi:hypothetical protein